ncbi:NADH:ubiquinone oxidoreductase subunit L [Alphaproteobacteria bacterium]|nr:NADH:ubiquinone oxidoreductase subunit L [Alphaproteobacteria bacterium]
MLFKISVYLAVFLPLAGFLVSGIILRLAPKKLQYFEDDHNPHHNFADKFAQIFTTICLFGSLLFSAIIFYEVWQNKISTNQVLVSWISSGDFVVNWSLKIDSLVAVMLIVVSGVSFLVHLYSIGYMHEDPAIARFMSYLSLFTFFMLMLVSADNFLQLFFGWEGVGVASYLLIGFWFKKQSANVAAMKAFIANRVGDCGLILAIALIFLTFGSVDYATVFANLNNHLDSKFTVLNIEFATLETIAILLFIGAMGKSAQIGLHVWLADAMEGPTPVSALIHAATMVTAGVFLVIRCSAIFELTPFALSFVTIIGALTAFFSATIALTQNDIKKIIAYSTCSQLGYMFFACGVSAYQPAIFHLATHAFFKALLFLSAGSVIHAMHHEQDIRKMGGIYKKIPITYAMMWIGSLALAGFPPFAGFFSKDAILESAFMSHSEFGKFAFALGIASAFLTAFYSWRLLFLTFHGHTRADHHTFEHAHESPKTMLIPLFILSIGSIFAGFIGVKYLAMLSAQNNFFSDAIFVSEARADLLNEIHHSPLIVKLAPMLVSIIAIALAYWFYIKQTSLPNQLAKNLKLAYNISFNKWYFDEIYDKIFVKPARKIGDLAWRIIDVKIIDGVPNGLAHLCKLGSTVVSKVQTGFIFNYALWMVLGLVGIIFYLVMSLKSLGVIVK